MTPNVALSKAHIAVTVSEYRGVQRLDARHLYERDGEWLPTKKGVNVPLDEALILIRAMLDAYNEATGEQIDLLDDIDIVD